MSFYLCNAGGFLLQLLPCVLLCFLPFPPDRFRFPWRRVILGMLAYVLAAAVLFPQALLCADKVFKGMRGYFANLAGDVIFLLATVAVVAAFGWLVRDAAIKKALVLIVVVFYASTQFWLVNLLLPFVPFDNKGYVYSVRSLFLYFVTMAVLLPIVVVMVLRPVGEFIRETGPKEMARGFRVSIVMTVAVLCVMMYSDTVIGYSDLMERALLFCPLFLLLIAGECMIYRLLFLDTLRNKRTEEQRRAIEIQRLQYEKIVKEIENTRRMRHDMRHHLNVLYEMLEQNRPEQAEAYLAELIRVTSRRENQVYCRNFTMNVLLQYYAGMARDVGIDCRVQADCGELPVSAADLTVLLGNAMENAVNACLKLPEDGNRWIDVKVGVIRSSLVIEIRNPCQGVYFSERYQRRQGFLPAAAFLSERKEGGFGLRSLSHTAKKYDGEAVFRYDDGEKSFTARIRLNLHPEML